MTKDIVPDLLDEIRKAFQGKTEKSKVLKKALEKLKAKEATYKDANEYAVELGNILAETFGGTLTGDKLPDGKMYYNIAKRILQPTFENNYDLVATYTEAVQTSLNRKAGKRIKGKRPKLNQDRIDGIVNRISREEEFEKARWLLDEPVRNFTQAVVDDGVRENAEFQYKSGLKPKIIRKEVGKCCDWCKELAGTYEYPHVPKDVYRRHRYCRCTVEYYPGDGRKQDVHTKKWREIDREEKIQERMEYSEEEKKKIGRERLEKIKRRYLSDYNIVIEDEILDLNPDVVSEAFDGIESMFVSHPDLKEKIVDIGLSNKGIMNCNGTRINFNPLYFSDNKKLKEDCKKMSEIGWWPKNSSPASIAVHEMGHAVNWDLITKNPLYENQIERILDWSDGATAKKIVGKACKKVKKTEFGKGKKNAELRQLQSGYGATSHAEAIAEAYADVFSNKDNANPLSKAIIDEINDLFSTYAKGEEGQ